MFGRFYVQRDRALAKDPSRQAEYARMLLAELLSRARLLEPLLLRAVEASDVDQPGYLHDLAAAVEIFLHDVEESAIRGQRAHLFAETDFRILTEANAVGDMSDHGGCLFAESAVP